MRIHYPTKADWATANLNTLRAEADWLRSARIPSSNWQAVRRKTVALAAISRDLAKFELLAKRYTDRGE